MTDAIAVWIGCGMLALLSAAERQPNVIIVLGAPHLVPKVWLDLVGRAVIGGPLILVLELGVRLEIPSTRGRVVSVFLGMLVGLTGGYAACA